MLFEKFCLDFFNLEQSFIPFYQLPIVRSLKCLVSKVYHGSVIKESLNLAYSSQ